MQIKALAVIGVVAATLSVGPAQAQSKIGGCLKYGLGGAIAGHVAGGHRVKGALAGCAIGVLERRRQEQAARERNGRNRTAERPRPEQVERDTMRERNRTAERRRPEPELRRTPPNREAASPYEDLGLDPSVSGRGGRATAPSPGGDPNAGGFGRGGTFSRSQPFDPNATGSVWPRAGGTVY